MEKRAYFTRFICTGTLAVLFLFSAAASAAGHVKRVGIVVEDIVPGGAAEAAGLQRGDLLLDWKSATAEGFLHDPFELDLVISEYGHTGSITLKGKRNGRTITSLLIGKEWGLEVRPMLSKDLRNTYRSAFSLLGEGKAGEASQLIDAVTVALKEASHGANGAWVYLKASEQFRIHKAIEAADSALKRAEEEARKIEGASGKRVLAAVLEAKAALLQKSNDLDGAISLYREAVELRYIYNPESLKLADTIFNLGITSFFRGDLDSAEKGFIRSLDLREKLAPGSYAVSRSTNAMGIISRKRGRYSEALDYYERTLALLEKHAPGGREVSSALNNIGSVAWSLGKLEKAWDYYHQAYEMRKELSPGSAEVAQSLYSLGLVARHRGDLDLAEGCYRDALEIHEEKSPGSLDVAMTLNALGLVAWHRGDLVGAEDLFLQCLEIQEKVAPESLAAANTLANLGILAQARADYSLAWEYQLQALKIRKYRSPGSLDEAGSHQNLGLLAQLQGNLEETKSEYELALAIYKSHAPESYRVANIIFNLATLDQNQGNLAEAVQKANRAAELYHRVAPGGLDISHVLHFLGSMEEERGNSDMAKENYLKALTIREKYAPGSEKTAETLHALGALYRRSGDIKEAAGYFSRAVDAVELQRSRLGGGERAEEAFSARHADIYRDLVEAFAEMGEEAEAFHSLEKYRAHLLLTMLAERDMDFSKDLDHSLFREQKHLRRTIVRIEEELNGLSDGSDAGEWERVSKSLQDARLMEKKIEDTVRSSSPKYAALTYPEPLDLVEAKKILNSGELFLTFSTGIRKTTLLALMDGELTVHTIPVPRKELESTLGDYRLLTAFPLSPPELLHREGRRLYDLLLGPVEKKLKRAKSVIICPDGPLHNFPFSTLRPGSQKYLVELMPLSYVISATVWSETSEGKRSSAGGTRAVLLGDPIYSGYKEGISSDPVVRSLSKAFTFPPLPGTRDEIEGIARLYGEASELLLGNEAREESVRAISGRLSVLHLSCHGLLDDTFPLNSGLVFSVSDSGGSTDEENGILQAWEIFESLRLDADLVALSACQTGLGEEKGGEGILGLHRAFIYAGARSVLSSRWRIADRATAHLMTLFHKYRVEGSSKAESLRQAQIDMIRSGKVVRHRMGLIPLNHPYHWAAFTLHGDP